MNGVTVTVMTSRGLVRPGNEDRVGALGWLSPTEMDAPTMLRRWASVPLVTAVADGLGGHRAGEVASRDAVAAVMADSTELDSQDALADRIQAVHARLLAAGQEPGRVGMATTLSVVVVLADRVLLGNVGDSRIYYVEPGLVEQLSADDLDPLGTGALTQVLGGRPGEVVKPWTDSLPVRGNTRLLLCSDGLHSYLPAPRLRELATIPDHAAAVYELHRAVYEAGAPDNVSVCLVDITTPSPAEDTDD